MPARLIGAILACVATLLTAPLLTGPAAHASDNGGEALKGTLSGPNDKPVPKVTITVESDGSEVGTDTTSGNGTWQIPVPEPGSYTVSLDTGTLPNGVQLRTEGGEVLEDVEIRSGQTRTLIFPLISANAQQESPEDQATESSETEGGDDGESQDAGSQEAIEDRAQDESVSFVERFTQQVVEGLKYGAIIAITAVGLSLVFGTTRLINFAHGEMVTIGAMAAFFFSASAFELPLVIATVLAMAIGSLVAAGMERGLYRPMRARGTGRIQLFIISIGLSLLLRHILLILFGSRRRQYDQYTVQSALDLGPIHITPRDLVITLLSAAVLLSVGFMLMRTRIGKATRAVADNKDLAEASGIDVDRVILIVWIMGGALAALGGVFYGLSTAVFWNMGFNLLLLMFAGVILGGLGSAFGAVVGSLVVGLVAQISTLWFAVELQNAWALLTLIIVLLVRPQGILGRAERKG